MAPINIGIIGLSSSAVTSWASHAHLPYLLSSRGRANYRIVALCNSSVAAARAAIDHYGLDQGTAAYGDPEDLAADSNVELVVCCTRVDTHYSLTRPSLAAGKSVFVEWPLTHDIGSSRDLANLAREKGVRTAIGLQSRLAPSVAKVREIVHGGKLGKVLSSEVLAAGGTIDRETVAEGLRYFTDRKVGGNVFMIGFAHLFDFVQSALGELTDVQSQLQLQRPAVKLRNPSTNTIVETVTSDIPDLIIVTGRLQSSDVVAHDATVLVRFRRGQQFKGEPALTWHVNCERGEIRVTSYAGSSLGASAHAESVKIEIHDFATDEAEEMDWDWPAWLEEERIPLTGASIAALYEEFAKGDKGSYPTLADALNRHEQLDRILSGWKA